MDAKKVDAHIACYGNTSLVRGYCPDCKRFAFVLDGRIQCCDDKVETTLKHVSRISTCPTIRTAPSRSERWQILREQDYRCGYCGFRFGTCLWHGRRKYVLSVTWDHWVPFSYSQNNHAANFVAACQICNRLKGSIIFKDFDEARYQLETKRKAKGYTRVPPVWGEVHPETPTSKIL